MSERSPRKMRPPVTISTHRRRINSRHRSRQSPIWSITPCADRECESAKRRKEFPPPHRFPLGRASYLITLSNEPLIGGCRPSAPRMSSAQCGGRRLDPQAVADSGACQGFVLPPPIIYQKHLSLRAQTS